MPQHAPKLMCPLQEIDCSKSVTRFETIKTNTVLRKSYDNPYMSFPPLNSKYSMNYRKVTQEAKYSSKQRQSIQMFWLSTPGILQTENGEFYHRPTFSNTHRCKQNCSTPIANQLVKFCRLSAVCHEQTKQKRLTQLNTTDASSGFSKFNSRCDFQ